MEAAEDRGERPDVRDYREAAYILREQVGDTSIRLLTNNPEKVRRLQEAGVEVTDEVPIEVEPTEGNREYLRVKKRLMGHRLTKV